MRLSLAALAIALAIQPAQAQDAESYFAQVPLLPLPDSETPDIESLLTSHWSAYWRASGREGFGRDQVRAGRFDLDNDGRPELFLMIAAEAWESRSGRPLVVASWSKKAWQPIGWSWGDTDSVFVTGEFKAGWRTLDTGPQLLRWDGKGYQPTDKQPAP